MGEMVKKIEKNDFLHFEVLGRQKHPYVGRILKKSFQGSSHTQLYMAINGPFGRSRSQMKTMLVCFFEMHGIMHHEFVPPHQTVMAKFYLEVLGGLKVRIMRVRFMTMHWHIHLSQYVDIWWKQILPHCHTHPAAQPHPLRPFSVHQTQVGAERDAIR